MCSLGTFPAEPRKTVLFVLSMCCFPNSTNKEAESRFGSRSSEAILSAHQPMEPYGPEAGLIGRSLQQYCVRARGETPRF